MDMDESKSETIPLRLSVCPSIEVDDDNSDGLAPRHIMLQKNGLPVGNGVDAPPSSTATSFNDPDAPTPPATTTASSPSVQSSGQPQHTVPPSISITSKTPPLICEQAPSGPSSPTSPGGVSRSKRPCPLSVDALQRFDLLSPYYMPGHGGTTIMDHHQNNKTSPVSPPANYPTSDLGSSPRSSISHQSMAGASSLLSPNWTAFRDRSDAESDVGSRMDCRLSCNMLSPHQLLSPALYSPFSDCGLEQASSTSLSVTPFSNRSPNLSPLPTRSDSNLHFSFDQVRSRSAMSANRLSEVATSDGADRQRKNAKEGAFNFLAQGLDIDSRERSRSESAMINRRAKTQRHHGHVDEDIEMEDISSANHSTFSVPVKMMKMSLQSPASYNVAAEIEYSRKRLLQRQEHVKADKCETHASEDEEVDVEGDVDVGVSASAQISRQPTIEEPPPSPTFTELFHSRDLIQLTRERQTQVEEWIRSQTAALEIFRNTLIPLRQESNLLQVPASQMLIPPSSIERQLQMNPFAKLLSQSSLVGASHQQQQSPSPGPIRPATLWRRSRSETDVSRSEATTMMTTTTTTTTGTGSAITTASSSSTMIAVPINESTCVCEHCGQGFAMHDRLAKHIASRHRDRSASMNDENSKVYKCSLCPKSFGRSDMLTRHLRLHSGCKPYACQQCGQVFSRSDHLSTHQRTHTGEKPYRCPFCQYSASRRDMITRHMKTHVGPDGLPIPFGSTIGESLTSPQPTLQLPPPIGQLSELSLASKNPTPEPSADTTPFPFTIMQRGEPNSAAKSITFAAEGTNKQNVQPMDIATAAARILSSVANGQLASELVLSTLTRRALSEAQFSALLHAQQQKSTPVGNELGTNGHSSAFKPPGENTLSTMRSDAKLGDSTASGNRTIEPPRQNSAEEAAVQTCSST